MTRHLLRIAVFLFLGGLLRAEPTNDTLVGAVVLENNVAYLRVGRVATGLADQIQAAQQALAATNQLAGTVLDLRFADGDNLAAAKMAADLFAAKKSPLAILVNGRTRGAALVLATTLREARDGLVFGSPAADLKPDITVPVKVEDEKIFLADPYAAPAQNATNTLAATNGFEPFIDHTSEADLVRDKVKDGDEDAGPSPSRASDPPKPFIHDPVLGRAVDLIKGLATLPRTRS